MKNEHSKTSLWLDLYTLAVVFVSAALAVTMMTTPKHSFLLVLAYLGVTVVSVLLTYFYGLVTGLIASLVFEFAQTFALVWIVLQGGSVSWQLAVWLIAPVLLNLSFAGMTSRQLALQEDNTSLREMIIENGAFDEKTKLRTTVSFLQDARVFLSTGYRFDIPVSVMTLRIRYFKDLSNMLGEARVTELIRIASETVRSATRDNDGTYILQRQDPTWAVIFYTDTPGTQIAAERIRKLFAEKLEQSAQLSAIDLDFKIGIHTASSQTQEDPNEFMKNGIKELEYDV